MIKRPLLLAIMLFSFSNIFSQNVLLQDYQSEAFELKYPKRWKVDITDNKYYFSYNANLGDITVSWYDSKNFSEKELKEMLLEINESKDPNPDIQVTTANGATTCFYKYTSNDVKYFTKAIQDNKRMFLISLNWQQDSWNEFKDVLLESFESLKIK